MDGLSLLLLHWILDQTLKKKYYIKIVSKIACLDQNSFPETASQKQYQQCYIPSEAKLNGSKNLWPKFLGVIVKKWVAYSWKKLAKRPFC